MREHWTTNTEAIQLGEVACRAYYKSNPNNNMTAGGCNPYESESVDWYSFNQGWNTTHPEEDTQ